MSICIRVNLLVLDRVCTELLHSLTDSLHLSPIIKQTVVIIDQFP